MPEHLHYEEEDIFNPETHHEESDVNVRALLWFVVIFVVFAVVTHFVILAMYKGFAQIARGDAANAPMTSVARPPDANVPLQPRLQPFPTRLQNGQVLAPNRNTPVTDLEDMIAAEDKVLKNYGWVDRQKGVVHIPIEDAKRLALQRNAFPVNAGVPTPPPMQSVEGQQP